MSCELYQDRLSEYVDLALPQREHEAVTAHLGSCSSCEVIYQDLLAIFRASRQMPQLEPPDRVWHRLEAAIAAESRTAPAIPSPAFMHRPAAAGRFTRPAFLIAAMLIAAVGSVSLYRWLENRREPGTPGGNVAVTGTTNWNDAGGPKADLRPINLLVVNKPQIETEIVERRIQQLEIKLHTRQSQWSDEVRGAFDKQLAAVNRTVEQGYHAMQSDRNDQTAKEIYQAALLSKVEMLKQFAEL